MHMNTIHDKFSLFFICLFFLFCTQLFAVSVIAGENSPDQPYELIMQCPTSVSTPDGLAAVENTVNQITQPSIGVKIKLKTTNHSVFDANLAISSGEKLDLCMSLYGGMDRLVENGYIIPLDDLIEQYGQQLKEVCNVQLKGGYYQNHLYGISPAYSEGQRYGFICRTDMMEKYNFHLEEGKYYTFDELEKFWKKVKAGEGENFYILGGDMICNKCFLEKSCCSLDVLGSHMNTGVLMLNRDNASDKIVDFYETDEFMDFARRMYRWNQEGFFYPNTSITEEDSNIMMGEGKILGWFFHNVPGEEIENTTKSGLDVTFIPTQEAVRTTDVNQNVLWSIPVTCENPRKVMEFLNLLYTDKNISNLLQRGVEGQSYVVTAQKDGEKLIDLPEGKSIASLPYYLIVGVYGNRLSTYVWAPGDIDRNKRAKEFSDNISLTSPAWGYVFDSGKVSVQISLVDQTVKKYIGIIETGAVDPEIEVPMFLSELKSAGIDDIISENQRQYDVWTAAQ